MPRSCWYRLVWLNDNYSKSLHTALLPCISSINYRGRRWNLTWARVEGCSSSRYRHNKQIDCVPLIACRHKCGHNLDNRWPLLETKFIHIMAFFWRAASYIASIKEECKTSRTSSGNVAPELTGKIYFLLNHNFADLSMNDQQFLLVQPSLHSNKPLHLWQSLSRLDYAGVQDQLNLSSPGKSDNHASSQF